VVETLDDVRKDVESIVISSEGEAENFSLKSSVDAMKEIIKPLEI